MSNRTSKMSYRNASAKALMRTRAPVAAAVPVAPVVVVLVIIVLLIGKGSGVM